MEAMELVIADETDCVSQLAANSRIKKEDTRTVWALLCFSGWWKPPFSKVTSEPGLHVHRMALQRSFRRIFAAILMATRSPHQRIPFAGLAGHPITCVIVYSCSHKDDKQ
ncbi:hypothetical protein PoB_006453800 [Plakobranchus ocellatus]|uniref:Uncharacterized protein n=1 Tax=Plakobranchus ocellatus TaxID=259542 RepID=A0AAV4D1W7_9GAST|nr:hypothetical protein PoB_006453800 [Plakobranchus ocellatus]